MLIRHTRRKKNRKTVEQINGAIQEDDHELEGEMEEVLRLGKYKEGAQQPVNISFRSQAAAEVVGKAWKLARSEGYKKKYG